MTFQYTLLKDGTVGGIGLSDFLTNHDLDIIKFWTTQSDLRLTTGGSDVIPIPQGFVDAATKLDGLSSYAKYKEAKAAFSEGVDKFITDMKVILRDGESDWPFAD